MNKRRWAIVSICLSLLIACILYYKKAKTTLTLGVFVGSNWDVPSTQSNTIIDTVIAQFEKKHPDVTIQYTSGIMKSDYSLWLHTKIMEGKEPDIYLVLEDDFNQLSALGAFQKLDSQIENDTHFDPTDYYSSSLGAGRYQGHQYALPYESNPRLMFVNRTLLEKESIAIPENWTLDQFYEICRKVTKDTTGKGHINQFGMQKYTWQDAVNSYGVDLFNEEGKKSYFNKPEVMEALTYIQKLEALTHGQTPSVDDFDKGNVAFTPMLFSQYRTYMPYPWKIKKYSTFTWDCIKMPTALHKRGKTKVDSLLFAMSARTSHKSLSWQLLKDLTYNVDTQKQVFQYSQGISPLKKVTQSKEVVAAILKGQDSMLDISVLHQAMEEATHTPTFKNYYGALKIADYQVNQMKQQGEISEFSLLSIDQQVNKYLKD